MSRKLFPPEERRELTPPVDPLQQFHNREREMPVSEMWELVETLIPFLALYSRSDHDHEDGKVTDGIVIAFAAG